MKSIIHAKGLDIVKKIIYINHLLLVNNHNLYLKNNDKQILLLIYIGTNNNLITLKNE